MFENSLDFFSSRHLHSVSSIALRTWSDVVALNLLKRDCLNVSMWDVNFSKEEQTKQQSFSYDRLARFDSLRISNINLRIHVNSLDLFMIRQRTFFIWARFSLAVFLFSALFLTWALLSSSFTFVSELKLLFNSLAFVTVRSWLDSATRLKRVDLSFLHHFEWNHIN